MVLATSGQVTGVPPSRHTGGFPVCTRHRCLSQPSRFQHPMVWPAYSTPGRWSHHVTPLGAATAQSTRTGMYAIASASSSSTSEMMRRRGSSTPSDDLRLSTGRLHLQCLVSPQCTAPRTQLLMASPKSALCYRGPVAGLCPRSTPPVRACMRAGRGRASGTGGTSHLQCNGSFFSMSTWQDESVVV